MGSGFCVSNRNAWRLRLTSPRTVGHPQVIDLMAAEAPWELVLRDGAAYAEPFVVDRALGIPASQHLLLRGRP